MVKAVNGRVKVCVNNAGAGKTHITLTRSPQLVAGKPVKAVRSNMEQEGIATVDVIEPKVAQGAFGLNTKLETAVANCPPSGILDNVKPFAVHNAPASLSGTGSKNTTGS